MKTMRRLVSLIATLNLTALVGAAFAAAPLGIGQVQVEVKENTLGKEKGTKYLRVHFTATVKEPVPQGMTVLVHGACKSDVRSKEGDISALGTKLDAVPAGGTKDIVVPLFISDGFHSRPNTCDLTFRYGKFGGRTGDKLASYCWSGGVAKEGACE
jgi:hypothetical protein